MNRSQSYEFRKRAIDIMEQIARLRNEIGLHDRTYGYSYTHILDSLIDAEASLEDAQNSLVAGDTREDYLAAPAKTCIAMWSNAANGYFYIGIGHVLVDLHRSPILQLP